MRFNLCLVSVLCLWLYSCSSTESQDKLFQRLSSEHTRVTFANTVAEDDSINILNYEYLYNGGGVGVLDVNNDGLSDLFFTGNQVANALYLNKGDFKFEDIAESAGVQLKNDWCTGVSIIDINVDGYDDIYVSIGGPGNKNIFPNKLFINQGDFTFKESAEEYGLADPGESIQSVFFDYDKDGDLDMYLLTGGGFEKSAITARPIMTKGESRNTDRLYRNTYDSTLGHAVFENVSAEAGIQIEGFGLGVSVLDANQDSWPDVYVSNDYLSRDLLYINNQDGTFTDRSLEFFRHTSHFSMGNDVGDINNDGLPDIITVDMLPENLKRRKLMFGPNDHDRFYMAVQYNYGYQYMRNMLHLNHGNNGFSEIGQLAGIERTDWSWAPLLADFDNDGYQDLFITNGFGKDITDLDFVKFRTESVSPFSSRSQLQKLFLDSLNQRPSVILPNYIYKNEKNLTFSDQSISWGITQPSISNGAGYADLDADGDLDLVVNNINQEAFIYKNTVVERDSTLANFLKVKLVGPVSNPSGLGATVTLYTRYEFQCRYLQTVRGFLSSVDKTIHFGVGSHKTIDSILVKWPDGKVSSISNIEPNSVIRVDYKSGSPGLLLPNAPSGTKKTSHRNGKNPAYFTSSELIEFIHKETPSNDFKTQPLLLRGYSNQGPGMAVGDVNGDGLDDVFIGGAYRSSGTLFTQRAGNKFEKKIISSEEFEDLGAVFFDADGDNDLDLYIASGGAERYAGHEGYQDRVYLNDGHGNFTLMPSALPSMKTSTSAVAAGDFDQDGDQDLFVGGRVSPGNYPEAPASYLLENQSGKFIDVTEKLHPSIRNIGMVTAAIWTDFNNDNLPDLVLTGESMRITFLKNNGSQLTDITDKTSLADAYGMWNSILPGDFDNDGDMDFVAGNLGLNNQFDVTPEKPLELHYADFDDNGSVDPIFTSYEKDTSWPLTSLDQLTKQLPMMKKTMLYYRDYAGMNTADLLRVTGKTSWKTLPCKVLATSFIENLGNDKFLISPLPVRAQFAPVNGMLAEDINLDGNLDLILVGNRYDAEVVNGRYDASIGTVLINGGGNVFKPLDSAASSFIVRGDARGIVRLELSDNRSLLLITQNNDRLVSYVMDSHNGLKRLRLRKEEVHALVTLSNGSRRKMEFSPGGSYLSHGSGSIVITPGITAIELFDSKGKSTRMVNTRESGNDRVAVQRK